MKPIAETQSVRTRCKGNALVKIVTKEAIGVLQDIELPGDDGGISWAKKSSILRLFYYTTDMDHPWSEGGRLTWAKWRFRFR